ncbi:DNA topoisomerase IV, alpha subunit [Coprinellus micaceus]|uniref:DNA topoisomerase IV, alpha subunit n=1 Tax=Coprinellus micaceus TaxID=71717 RepID=A0A4Y7RX87_COPMI|nr:DNA topoisomerase IV, alpha subunit [Coprinellus micaceus]
MDLNGGGRVKFIIPKGLRPSHDGVHPEELVDYNRLLEVEAKSEDQDGPDIDAEIVINPVAVIRRLRKMVSDVFSQLRGGRVVIGLKAQQNKSGQRILECDLTGDKLYQPGAYYAIQLVTIFVIAEWNILSKRPIVWTARLLHYFFPWLFPAPSFVARILGNICEEFEIDSAHFGVSASPKGEIAGAGLTIETKDGTIITLSNTFFTRILDTRLIVKVTLAPGVTDFVVLEALCSGRPMVEAGLTHETALGDIPACVLRGLPDQDTRRFLKMIQRQYPRLRFRAFVDWNPAGAGIMKLLKCGSLHQGYFLDYALDNIDWVGPRRDQFPPSCIERFHPLSGWDRARAISMLAREEAEANLPRDWTAELKAMYDEDIKIDFEHLCCTPGTAIEYIVGSILARRSLESSG